MYRKRVPGGMQLEDIRLDMCVTAGRYQYHQRHPSSSSYIASPMSIIRPQFPCLQKFNGQDSTNILLVCFTLWNLQMFNVSLQKGKHQKYPFQFNKNLFAPTFSASLNQTFKVFRGTYMESSGFYSPLKYFHNFFVFSERLQEFHCKYINK